MKKVLLIACIFYVSCRNHNPSNNVILTQADSLKAALIGEWGGLGENTPVWKFMQDSMYNFGDSQTYSYKIINNDIVVKLSDHNWTMKNISIIQDTLIFGEEGRVFAYRFRKH
jgi:hypothetical protein